MKRNSALFQFDDKNYQKEVEEIAIDDVYRKMVDFPKQYPKTSLPSVQNYVDAFTPHVKEGRAVICVCITTSLSGSYNSACNAKEIVCEEYHDAKITVINSLGATVSQGLAGMVHIFNPQLILIGGGVSAQQKLRSTLQQEEYFLP